MEKIQDYRQPIVTASGIFLGFMLGFSSTWVRDAFTKHLVRDIILAVSITLCISLLMVVLYRILTMRYPANIFVNKPNETKYIYQDRDASGLRLDGNNNYTVTFAKGQLPPVKGFWSLTLYSKEHFFVPNELNRYSLGTKNKNLQYDADGSLTLYVQSTPPEESKKNNWLPAPKEAFSLYIRCYWPDETIVEDKWTPPPVKKQ